MQEKYLSFISTDPILVVSVGVYACKINDIIFSILSKENIMSVIISFHSLIISTVIILTKQR